MSDDRQQTTSGVVTRGVELRPIGLRDLPAVQVLYAQQSAELDDPFTRLIANENLVAWNLRRLRQQLIADERYVGCLASLEEQVIGYAAAVIEQQAPVFELAMFGSISELYVAPEHRRMGVATLLLDHLVATLAALGMGWVEFTAHVQSEGAVRLLERRGYKANTVAYRHRLEARPGEGEKNAEGGG